MSRTLNTIAEGLILLTISAVVIGFWIALTPNP